MRVHFKYSKPFPNPKASSINPPITINDAKDLTFDILNMNSLVLDIKYHVEIYKTIMNLCRCMLSHKVDYVRETFEEGLQMKNEEENSNTHLHHLWFIKMLREHELHVPKCLKMSRQLKKDSMKIF